MNFGSGGDSAQDEVPDETNISNEVGFSVALDRQNAMFD
jgi:hypothetical protein